jgi:hypothetical protein
MLACEARANRNRPITTGNDAAARLLSIFALRGETFEQRAIFSIGEPLPSCLEFGKVK